VTPEEKAPAQNARRPRRARAEPPPSSPASRDQGDLWSDTATPAEPVAAESEAQALIDAQGEASELDLFVAALPDAQPVERVEPPAPVRATGARRHATPASSIAVPPRPDPVPEYDYAPDDYEDGGYSMLRNPYVLAGLAVAVAIVAAVFVVILFGSGGDGGGGGGGGVVSRPLTPQPGDDGGLKARSIAIAAVREGPGRDYAEIGLLRSSQDVSVVGRNEQSTWYEIIYPASSLQGWVPATALRLPENSDALIQVVSFTPIPKPSVEQPTATAPAAATPTEQALGAPDLELATLGGQCPAGQPVTLALRNVGVVPVNNRQVNVIVTTQNGNVSQSTMTLNLAPGQAVPIATGQVVQAPRTTFSVVFTSLPQDSNPSNNIVVCTAGAGGGSNGPGSGSTAVPPPIGSTPDPDDDD
jgi:hypothetical protein